MWALQVSFCGRGGSDVASSQCVTATEPAWVWIGGQRYANAAGIYNCNSGTFCYPGGRGGHSVWMDANGATYLFGGVGIAAVADEPGLLNDLWKLPPRGDEESSFVRVSHSICGDVQGWADVYGDNCSTYVANGWCCQANDAGCNAEWADPVTGYDSDVGCCLSCCSERGDCDEFHSVYTDDRAHVELSWYFLGGSTTPGAPSSATWPGARHLHAVFVDRDVRDHAWLLGGFGIGCANAAIVCDDAENLRSLDDLWYFSAGNWSMVGPTVSQRDQSLWPDSRHDAALAPIVMNGSSTVLMVGGQQRTESTGTWSISNVSWMFEPNCTDGLNVRNSPTHCYGKAGDVCEYTCVDGYEVAGAIAHVCLANGSFVGGRCELCAIGYHASEADSRGCQPCLAGTVDDDSNPRTPCVQCDAGQFASAASTVCRSCNSGEVDADADPATPCTSCPAGKHTPAYSMVNAVAHSNVAYTACIPCQMGRYSFEEANRCIDCLPGLADTDLDPSTPCANCSVGHYSTWASLLCEVRLER